MKNVFITGTDTGVGKTLVTSALLHLLQTRGISAAPMKPVAAGTIDVDGAQLNEDVALMQVICQHRHAIRDVNPYCMAEAVAPHIAAALENVAIDPKVIQEAFTRLSAQSDCVIVEGAGGFLVPLNALDSMAVIPSALNLEIILVVGMKLGCLNHAVLTAEAIGSRGLHLAGWVANVMTAIPMNRVDENIASLQLLLKAPLLGTIPFLGSAKTKLEQAVIASAHLQIDSLL